MRRSVSTVFTLLLAWGLVLLTPGAALAHDVLEKTTPANGTTVAQLPQEVILTFSDTPIEVGTQIIVTSPSGNVANGAPTIDGPQVVQQLLPQAPAGDYTVTYRVTSQDGHPISGTFGFHATVGLDGSTATPAATVHAPLEDSAETASADESRFVPILLTTVAVILFGILIGLAVRVAARRRGRTDNSDNP
ncbi:MAG: copper resistance protein CopC [Micrococcales bacterium]|nr:copper resistance protein CopC [Micrococcales bacterium]